jgi:L-lactate dehydrogenase complex protein LldE
LTIDLFITCLNDAMFPRTGEATVKLLERLGHAVRFNDRQTCCGQMHFNSGYQEDALKLVRHFVETTKAEACTAGDNSCLMHIGGGLSRLQAGTRTVHLAEILASTEQEVFT